MSTVQEQIGRRCIHFNGIMNKVCEKGINYADVRGGQPYKFPCLKQGGHCEHAQFPTAEQLQEEFKKMEDFAVKAVTAAALVKAHFQKTKEKSGTLKCECGGELKYVVAERNGHIWARCSSCKISFNE